MGFYSTAAAKGSDYWNKQQQATILSYQIPFEEKVPCLFLLCIRLLVLSPDTTMHYKRNEGADSEPNTLTAREPLEGPQDDNTNTQHSEIPMALEHFHN